MDADPIAPSEAPTSVGVGIAPSDSSPASIFRTWHRLWLWLGGLSAVLITFVDGVLLHTKFNFFTGGFLTTEHLQGWFLTTVFLLSLLAANAGVTFPLAALGIWLLSTARLNARPSTLAIVALGATPLLTADFLLYRLHEFLGDAFDLAVSFDVAGRSATEILVVAAPHLKAPLALIVGLSILVAFLIWLSKHLIPGGWIALPRAPVIWRFFLENLGVSALALIIVGLAFTNNDTLAFGLERTPAGKLYAYLGDRLTDFDSDGFGMLRRPRDPAPFDAKIYPYAIDIPGNGIDEDGIAGDLPAKALVAVPPAVSNSAPWTIRPNVVWFVLESFRADLVGADYLGKPITPVLNRLAAEGVSASAAYTHSGFTTTSRYHMFTGALAYAANHPSLIDDFKAHGYQVAFFSAQDESFGDRKLDIGFARSEVAYDARNNPELRYTAFSTPASIALPWEVMVAKISAFLAQRRDDRPLLLHVNLQDAHFPYHHAKIRPMLNDVALPRTKIDPDHAEALRATYQNTAANVDFAVGQILADVKRHLHDPSPGIIVMADHGETLFDDHLLGHGQAINDVQTRIPFIVANLPMVIDEPFGQADIRRALVGALEDGNGGGGRPRLVSSGRSEVLHYLGDLDRPRQIALRTATGMVWYDFRSGRVQLGDARWRAPEELAPGEYERFKALVNRWEALRVANVNGGRPRSEPGL